MAIDYSRSAQPKGSSRLDRAIASRTRRLADARQLRAWALAVKTRDQWRDRKTNARLRRCLDLDPTRAEAHHIEPKATRATRYDVRNGITLSLALHEEVELGRYRIEGTQFFTIDGHRFIDATHPVIFVRLDDDEPIDRECDYCGEPAGEGGAICPACAGNL